MAVTKINGFQAPYRSQTLRNVSHAHLNVSGLLSMAGPVSDLGSAVLVPPFKFLQQGLIVVKDDPTTVAKPSISGWYHLVVSSPSINNTNDLIFTFAKSPEDLSGDEVVLASFDGNEWVTSVALSTEGLLIESALTNLGTGKVGVYNGLHTKKDGGNYVNELSQYGFGALIDKSGRYRRFNAPQSFPIIPADDDFDRVDRIVYRKPNDDVSRIGERKLLLGRTYSSISETISPIQLADATTAKSKVKVLIAPDNSARVLTSVGYGENFVLTLTTLLEDRTFVSETTLAYSLTHDNFDAVMDGDGRIYIVYVDGVSVKFAIMGDDGTSLVAPSTIGSHTTQCLNPRIALTPDESRVFIVYQCLVGGGNNNIFFTSRLPATGAIVTAPLVLAGGANLVEPDLFVTEDFWVYAAWRDQASGAVFYNVFNDIGGALEQPKIVSTDVPNPAASTVHTGGGKLPRIWVADNREVFVAFLQNKGGTSALSIWRSFNPANGLSSAQMYQLIGPTENFTAFDIHIDSIFNNPGVLVTSLTSVDFFKLAGNAVEFGLDLSSVGATSASMAFDKKGAYFHAWAAYPPGTYTSYDTGVDVRAIGPGNITGTEGNVSLTLNQLVVVAADLAAAPKVGEQITVSSATNGGNNGAKIIVGVESVSLNGVNDLYRLTVSNNFNAAETTTAAQTAFARPDGNASRSVKTVAGRSVEAGLQDELSTDLLLTRIINADVILNRPVASGRPGSLLDYLVPYGPATIDWGATAAGKLTIGAGLKLSDLFINFDYTIGAGSYSMAEGDALYVTLGINPTVIPAVLPVGHLPWSDPIAVIGVIKGGRFYPALLGGGDFDQLQNGESVIFGEDLPSAIRARLGIVNDVSFQPYTSSLAIGSADTYPQAISTLDLVTAQNSHISLQTNGAWSIYAPNTLELVSTLILVPGVPPARNAIADQSITLSHGQIAYVNINRTGTAPTTLTVQTATLSTFTPGRDTYILGICLGSVLWSARKPYLPGASLGSGEDYHVRSIPHVAAYSSVSSLPTGASFSANGYTVNNGDRVLFTHASLNGVYMVSGVGSALLWTQIPVFGGSVYPQSGDLVSVENALSSLDRSIWIKETGFNTWLRLADMPGDLQEDRSAYLRSDKPVKWTGTQLEFTTDLFIEVIYSRSGTTELHKIEASASPLTLNNGESAWVEIVRGGAETLALKKTSVNALPQMSPRYKDVFVLFKRFVGADGKSHLHLPFTKQTISQGQSTLLGASGGGLTAANFSLTNNQTTPANIPDFAVSAADGDQGFTAEYCIQRTRLPNSAALDTGFNTNLGTGFNDNVMGLAERPDGKIVLAGWFSTFNGNSRGRLVVLNPDGTEESAFIPGTGLTGGSGVEKVFALPDNRVIAIGSFNTYKGVSVNSGFVCIKPDGDRDSTFASAGTFNIANVLGYAVQADGYFLFGGDFTSFAGHGAPGIVRLSASGIFDSSFNPGTGFNGMVRAIAVQEDGKILVGGAFTSFNGTAANRIVRLNSDGSLDPTFVYGSGCDAAVYSVHVLPEGQILLAGSFTTYNGTTANRIVKLSSDGSIDGDFAMGAGFNGTVLSSIVKPNGAIILGGSFTQYQSQSSWMLIKLNSDGTINTLFTTGFGTGFGGSVQRVTSLADGNLLVGGAFTTYKGSNIAPRAAKLNDQEPVELVKQGSIRGRRLPLSGTWELGGEVSIGDDTGVGLSITNAGQVQYTTSNIPLQSTNEDSIRFGLIKT